MAALWRVSDHCYSLWTFRTVVADYLFQGNFKMESTHFLTSFTGSWINCQKHCKVERNDRDVCDNEFYGKTEIEKSNYPGILTHWAVILRPDYSVSNVLLLLLQNSVRPILFRTNSMYCTVSKMVKNKVCISQMQQMLIIFSSTAQWI